MAKTRTESNDETSIGLFQPDLLGQAVSFLHGTHFRSVATSCKLLLNAYVVTKTSDTSGYPDYELTESNKKTTSMRVVVSSIRNIQLFERDHRNASIDRRKNSSLPAAEFREIEDMMNRDISEIFWRSAARYGNFQTLSYVLGLGVPIFCRGRKKAIIWAMEGSQSIDVIRLLIKHFRFCPDTFVAAARLGRLDCLKSLRYTRTFDARTCTEAAKNGNYDILVWAREAGCAWSEETHLFAMRGDDDRIKKYVVKEGCPAYSSERIKRENAYLSSRKRRR